MGGIGGERSGIETDELVSRKLVTCFASRLANSFSFPFPPKLAYLFVMVTNNSIATAAGKMSTNNTTTKKAPSVIDPKKCIIEDLEVLAFDNEEQMNYYTIWHEALVDKRRELNAESERERQIIKNEIARKTRQLIGSVGSEAKVNIKRIASRRSDGQHPKSSKISTVPPSPAVKGSPVARARLPLAGLTSSSPRKGLPSISSTSAAAKQTLASNKRAVAAAAAALRKTRPGQPAGLSSPTSSAVSHERQGLMSLPNGLTILNSAHYNSAAGVGSKQMVKYKLTKLYNKFRGRQERRNFVLEKQRNAKIEVEISRSYLNSWLAYTALQALRLPESNVTSNIITTAGTHSKILTPMAQQTAPPPPPPPAETKKKKKSPTKKQQQQQQHLQQQQQFKQPANSPPMHLVYIDPGNIITYSNRINPQQVAEYRQKSHILPSAATSKKSSAASYDVYEIMEVLANTTKTNVTITRNANRPSQAGPQASIYSHSVNANTPGIVSTQLHLQARSYLDSMSKFYAEEAQRLAKEQEEMDNEPTCDELVSRYLKLDHS